jgi:hypothetical protein
MPGILRDFPRSGNSSAPQVRRLSLRLSLSSLARPTGFPTRRLTRPPPAGGYDSWCPRDDEGGAKYWDRVPLNAMIGTGYFNCLYGTALTARALSQTGCEFSLLICPAVPTHPRDVLIEAAGIQPGDGAGDVLPDGHVRLKFRQRD